MQFFIKDSAQNIDSFNFNLSFELFETNSQKQLCNIISNTKNSTLIYLLKINFIYIFIYEAVARTM